MFRTEEELRDHTTCKYLDSIPAGDLKGEDRIKKQAWDDDRFLSKKKQGRFYMRSIKLLIRHCERERERCRHRQWVDTIFGAESIMQGKSLFQVRRDRHK